MSTGSSPTQHLDPRVAPSENLSEHAARADAAAAYPFDADPKYEELFLSIAKGLHRRNSGHVLLVAERGVGASTILLELARRAAAGQIPFLLKKNLLSVDCRYTAPDESRLRLIAVLSQLGSNADLVVCIDGFASLLRAERGSSNKATLLSALTRIRCQLVGVLTPHDYDELVADDPDMLEFFSPVIAEEPDIPLATKLLHHYAVGLSQMYQVEIEPESIQRAVVLSANYILNERLPAKAVKILQQVCEDLDFQRGQQGNILGKVTSDHVTAVVAQKSGVPEETLRGVADRTDYEESLGRAIVSQPHAVREVATELGLIKAGLTDRGKPASVMLFVGQTGTGKTEMAKTLARFYSTSKRLRTYTLGNFVEPHSVSGIIGVPAGYVGHEQGGRIVNDLNSDPYCVVLLDEADKAHPDVMQPFLNLFDEGWVVDQRGAKAFADRAIFILTTNVGQRQVAQMAKEGKSVDEITAKMKEILAQTRHTKSNRPVFAPEFVARLKRVVVFMPLDREAMAGICRNLVATMQGEWRDKREKDLVICDDVVERIADLAHDLNDRAQGREGGRIVRKLLADRVEAPLQREISRHPERYLDCGVIEVAVVEANAEAEPSNWKTVVRFDSEA